MAERSFYLIVYDIVDDKRRLKTSKALLAMGERVQRSVFEIYLTEKELKSLLRTITKWIRVEEDSLRVYVLCEFLPPKSDRHWPGSGNRPTGANDSMRFQRPCL